MYKLKIVISFGKEKEPLGIDESPQPCDTLVETTISAGGDHSMHIRPIGFGMEGEDDGRTR